MSTSATKESTLLNRQERVRLIRKYADTNTDGLLEESCQAFQVQGIEGFLGYRIEDGYAVVFGDPPCSDADRLPLTQAFHDYCKEHNIGIVYTIISKEYANCLQTHFAASIIEFGEKFILEPFHNPKENTGPHAVLVRKKVKHAEKAGVTIHEYVSGDPDIEKQILAVAENWVAKRKGPQIFLAHVTLFNDKAGKRWFYAKQNGTLVGFLVLNRLDAKNGWLMNNVMLLPNAPNGLSELLIIKTLETLKDEGCHYLVAGPVTTKELGAMEGMHSAVEQLIRFIFKGVQFFFHLDGYEAFWLKFDPKTEGSFLAFPNNDISYSSVKAILHAFNMKIGMPL